MLIPFFFTNHQQSKVNCVDTFKRFVYSKFTKLPTIVYSGSVDKNYRTKTRYLK